MARRKIVWSNRAKEDLIQILDYFIVRNGAKTYSLKLNKSFRKAVKLLSKYPYIGFLTDINSVRGLVEANYIIFYRIANDDIIDIIRIWDARSNPEDLKYND